ncbi:MAG TPA: hypothetical protein VFS24_03855 [Steroidobacteraceae bacterium]|nr:hypothetical protein [Steroidobacteraceae bacterium]
MAPDNKNATAFPPFRRRVALRKSWKLQPILPARPEKAAHYTQRFAVLQGKVQRARIAQNPVQNRWRAAMLRIKADI